MKRLIVCLSIILTGCGMYTESDLENARNEGYTEENLNEAYETGYGEGQENGYAEGYEAGQENGYAEGYEEAVELAQQDIETAYNEGVLEGRATSQDNLIHSSSTVDDISDYSLNSIDTFGTPSIGMDGYDWGLMFEYDKRELIEAIAENNGEYLSRKEVEAIIYLIDGFYENGGKYKTVGEVLEELQR